MKRLLNAIAGFMFLFMFAGAIYAETDVEKGTRLAKMYDRMPTFSKVKAFITLRMYDRAGNIRFTKKIRMASSTENLGSVNEVEKFMGYFTEPADDMGNSMLFINYADRPDEKHIYMKAIRKSKKVTGADKKLSFFGSDFSNAEVSMPEFQDYNYRYLKDGKVVFKGKELECYIVECLPKTQVIASEMGYGKKILYFEKNTLIMLKTEYYNQSMVKIKEHELISFITKNNIQGKKVYYNTGVVMRNVLKGTKTMLNFSDYLFEEDSGINDKIFSLEYLTRKWW